MTLATLSTYFTKNILCLLFSTCKHTVGLIKLIIISSTYLAKLTYLCASLTNNHPAKKVKIDEASTNQLEVKQKASSQ